MGSATGLACSRSLPSLAGVWHHITSVQPTRWSHRGTVNNTAPVVGQFVFYGVLGRTLYYPPAVGSLFSCSVSESLFDLGVVVGGCCIRACLSASSAGCRAIYEWGGVRVNWS